MLWGWVGSFLSFSIGLLFKESVIVTPLLGALVLWFSRSETRKYARLVPMVFLIFPYLWLRQRVVGPALPPTPFATIWLFFYNVFSPCSLALCSIDSRPVEFAFAPFTAASLARVDVVFSRRPFRVSCVL